MPRLRQLLTARKITRDRFRLPLTAVQAADTLTAAYQVEVEFRGRDFIADTCTADNIRAVADALTAPRPKSGILLCGTSGNGKTTMLYAFQNAVNFLAGRGILPPSAQIRIEFAKNITDTARQQERTKALSRLPMLAIEDMGREPTEVLDFGNVISPVVDMLEYRYDKQLFTFVTTNLTPREIREKYGSRIADRFNEMLATVIFRNNSYRTP